MNNDEDFGTEEQKIDSQKFNVREYTIPDK
jgi:hypothetical protein